MTISFGETFTKIQECFQEPEISSLWTANLQSVTIIRDVYGAIRLYLEHDDSFKPQQADINTLETSLSQKLGSYYGKDIWLPQGEQDGYKPLIQVILDERVPAEWNDDTLSPRWYILERHVAKKAWTDKNSGSPPWENVIRRLARPLAQEQLPVILAHALAPALREVGRVEELKAFADKAYQTFQENYYYESDTVPNLGNSDAPFTPVVLPLQDDLRGDIALFPRDESQEEASRLSEIVKVITSDVYERLAMRLCRLFGREFNKKRG